ncbi:MAG: hypothetical protein ACRCXT_11900 [Paraclostridium sp.]
MRINVISKMVRKKTSSYLKGSFFLFIFMMILMSTVFISVINQYSQLKNDFIDNNNMHIIEVNSFINKSMPNKIESLKYEDKKNIYKKIKDKYPNSSFNIYTESSIAMGISDKENNTFFIYSMDNTLAKSFGLDLTNNNGYLTTELSEKKSTLSIPIIDNSSDGYVANDYYEYVLNIKPLPQLNSPFIDTSLEKLYVSEETYEFIIGKIFEKNLNDETIKSLDKILIYIDDLSNVKQIGELLNDDGYNCNYTFSAFNDMSSSLKNTTLIGMILIIFIVLISCINIVVSFNLYFKNLQKDIGILKHYGYDSQLIFKIYKRTFEIPFIISLILILIYSFIISVVLMKSEFIKVFCIASVVIMIMMYIIYFLISLHLKKICNKELLFLVKYSKQFE